MFLVLEFLDTAADIGSLGYSLAANHLTFTIDDRLVKTVQECSAESPRPRTILSLSVVISVLFFAFEVCLHRRNSIQK